MKRLLLLLVIALLAIAACGGGSGAESTPTPDDSGRGTTEVPATPTPEPTQSPNPTSSPGERDTDASEAGSGEEGGEPTPEGTPVDAPDPEPTTPPEEPAATPEPTPTTPGSDPALIVYPTFEPLPDITSCDHAADLAIDALQIWLDSLAGIPIDLLLEDGEVSPEFDDFMALMDDRMTGIEEQATTIGCETEELEELIFARLDQLVANNETADYFLDTLWDMAVIPEPTLVEIVEPTEAFIDARFETCKGAADLFIELVQALIFDAITDMTLEELEADLEPPEPVLQFIEEVERMRVELAEVGCTEIEVTELIGERLDQIIVIGEAAAEIFASLEEAIAEGNIFDDIN